MEIENIAGVCLAARRTLKDKRHLTVCYSLFRQVIVYYKSITAGISEILADCNTGKRCEITHRGRLRSGRCHNHCIIKGAMLLERIHYRGDRRSFLADCNIDAINRLAFLIALALVDDSIDGYSSFADLAVADDKLSLTTADRHHRVNSLKTGLQRLLHRLAVDNTGSLALERQTDQISSDRTVTVDWLSKNVDYTSQQALAYGYRSDLAGAAHCHVLGYLIDIVEQDDAHVALFEVHGNALDAVFKFYKLVGADIVETIDMGYTVANVEHGAYFLESNLGIDVFELLFQYLRYLAGIYHCMRITCCCVVR